MTWTRIEPVEVVDKKLHVCHPPFDEHEIGDLLRCDDDGQVWRKSAPGTWEPLDEWGHNGFRSQHV